MILLYSKGNLLADAGRHILFFTSLSPHLRSATLLKLLAAWFTAEITLLVKVAVYLSRSFWVLDFCDGVAVVTSTLFS